MEKNQSTSAETAGRSGDIAIIGMAGRFPGARNIDEYWANLVAGVESIRRLSDEDLLRAGVPMREFEDPDYVRACPVLDDIDKFDAAFFGLSPRDASVMDPAHRFFLEVAWEALEHSGNTGLPNEGSVGVFATSGAPLYWMNNVRSHREIIGSMGEFLVRHTGNDMNFLATRASYNLDLRGPSLNVQTACSSALVAAHLARQSLLSGECDMALVGGSTINNPMGHGYHYKEGEILSRDGHCRPFDHRSDGTVFGSGTACLVFKRLEDALDNGDTIHALIKGSAANNDGSVKVGYLAPGVEGQVDVIKKALKSAQVSARSICYVEAHGTGTSVGDPIELTALEQAFSDETQDKQFCGIGSLKSNIGHLGEAAAAASLIKVALALKHRTFPPTLGYESPNPRFDMDNSPFFVTAKTKRWEGTSLLRAGITALGAGGTNCHMVMEEPPKMLPGEGGRARQLLTLSAKTKTALDRMSKNLASHLEAQPEVDLADVAYTLAMGRRPLAFRRVLVASENVEAVALLRAGQNSRVASTLADSSDPEVVFTFPGGGAQYARMCCDLYGSEPTYQKALDECFSIIERELSPGLRSLLFAAEHEAEAATKKLQKPSFSLPTLFAVEYALARLYGSYGIVATAFIGHSMGEYVAACLAGVFSLQDGLRLVHLRGKLFEKVRTGKMIGVSLAEDTVRSLMPQGLSIAAVNGPELCVASGTTELIDAFASDLTRRDIDWTPIHIDVAAHSSLLDPILEEFRTFCKTIPFKPPQKPIASNLTGRWLTTKQATDPEYWVQHLRNTVRFADCVETVLENGNKVFLEIGPGRTLTTLVGAQKTKVHHAINSVRHPKEAAHDVEYALLTLGKLWAAGAQVDWTALYDEQLRNRIALPTYPFESQSYWVEAQPTHTNQDTEPVKRENMDEWFAAVTWEQAPLLSKQATETTHWLVVASDRIWAQALISELRRQCAAESRFTLAVFGPEFKRISTDEYALQEASAAQFKELLELLKSEEKPPNHVVLFTQTASTLNSCLTLPSWLRPRAAKTHLLDDSEIENRLATHFFAPVHIGQVLTQVLDTAAFTIVTEGAFSISGEHANPWASLSLGPAQVLPKEWPEFPTRLIDLPHFADSQGIEVGLYKQLARELVSGAVASPVALRSPQRWVQRIHPTALPTEITQSQWIHDGDVILVTGGLGGIGLAIAEHLARGHKVKLALLSREGLPPRGSWSETIASSSCAPQLKKKLTQVLAIEALGAQVLAVQADVSNAQSLQKGLSQIRSTWGPISAAIHAAGTMDDELLQTKSDAKMRRVLAAKVQGTLHLDALLGEPLNLFVVMSSIASFLGLPGQVDYTAANAFLDAFALSRQARKKGRTLAINWNAWRDVGMVVNAQTPVQLLPMVSGQNSHVWLQAAEQTPQGWRYFTDFGVQTHWLLAEHKIKGASALIPGTGFVELARAAFVDSVLKRGLEAPTLSTVLLRQVTFLQPFQVPQDQYRRIQIDVDWNDSVATVTLRSTLNNVVHMTAELELKPTGHNQVNLDSILSRCTTLQALRGRFLDQDFVDFGPRWGNLEQVRLGQSEALIHLTLPEEFSADIGALSYHPALMDMATGAAQALIPRFNPTTDFFVPFGYDAIRIESPVTAKTVSHVRIRPETSPDLATFDVSVFDSGGRELIAIDGFTMRRVKANAAIAQVAQEDARQDIEKSNPTMQALLREAITRQEGVVAFDRATAQTELAQVLASSVDVNVWLRKLALDAQRLTNDQSVSDGPSFARPSLLSDYSKPEGEVETQLAAIWSKLLGIADVGATDDFFELGGNSLVAVRLFARVKKDFEVTLPLSSLFQAPTIRLLAEVLGQQGYRPAQTSEPKVPSNKSTPTLVTAPLIIRPGLGKPPVFFVHDGLGEVLLYRSLALKLDTQHPIYGLEPEKLGDRFLHTRIVDMARAKVERIRTVQAHGPYLLAGLCAGGVIAVEIARQLEEAGEKTAFLGIIDAADVAAKARPLRIARERWNRLLAAVRPAPGTSLFSAPITTFRKASGVIRYEFSRHFELARNARKVAQLRISPPESNEMTPEIGFIKLYEIAHHEHQPHGQLHDSHVSLFLASHGDGSIGDIPFKDVYTDPQLGWQQRVHGGVHVIEVPGGHSSALQEPHVSVLARTMQVHIDLALQDK